MGRNSTRVVFDHVIDSKLVPRRLSAKRQRRICFLFAFNEKQQMLRFAQHDMRTFATAFS
jgi:hypothetical protein